MKKRTAKLLTLLCLAALLLALPAPALAAGAEEHTHCLCGAQHASIGDHTAEKLTTFTAWSDTTSLPSEAGNYYLTADVTLSAEWKPADGTVLCLNGHSITGAGGKAAISIPSGNSFTLTDCTETPGKITHAEGSTGSGVSSSGTFNMYGGSITGNTASNGGGVNGGGTFNMYGGNINGNKASSLGGGVYRRSGTFSMYGGSISDNTASSWGGGVYTAPDYNSTTFNLYDGTISGNTANKGGGVYGRRTFNMYGGSISDNTTSSWGGGGVYNDSGTFTMTGGTISGNTSNSSSSGGGGVFNYGKFELSGGTISGNTAKNGGGVYNNEASITVYFNMCGGTITDNTASNYGGGVYSDNTFTMTDGTVSGNKAASGGGVYIYDDAFELSGGDITGNTASNGGGVFNAKTFTMSDGTIADNEASTSGGGVYNDGVFTLSGGEISGNTAEGTDTASGGGVVSSGTFELSGSAQITNNTAKATGEEAWVAGGGVHNRGALTMTGGEISGNTLESPYQAWGGGVQNVQGATFTMTGGTISGNTAQSGGGVYNYGTFELSGDAIITGNTVSRSGGGVFSSDQDSTFTMSGGTISDNTSSYGGVMNYSTFTMTGGSITGNTATATHSGGGVDNAGTFTMTGGTISGNTSVSGSGGGVGNYGTFCLSGDACISDNTVDGAACNVYLDDVCSITVPDGGFTGRAGITTSAAPTDDVPICVVTGGAAYADCFTSDRAGFELAAFDGSLWLKTPGSQLTAAVLTELALCYTQEVYSVDYVFDVGGTGTITAVELLAQECMHEWNVKDAKLYVSIAASAPIPACRALAQVRSLGEITLTPVSLLINGTEAETTQLHHGDAQPMPERAPTCDQPGSTGGTMCSVCGAVLSPNTVLPAHSNLEKTAAKAATCTESGNTEYWSCPDCGKYYLDAQGTNETTLSAVTLPALGHNYVLGICTRCGAEDPDYVPDAGTGRVVVKAAEGRPGETVSVTISLESNPGIISMLLEVGYDASVMTLTGVTDAGILGSALHSDDLTRNPYQLTWENGTAPADFTAVGDLVTLTFTIAENAAEGSYPITLTCRDTLNCATETVAFAAAGSALTVSNVLLGDVNGDGVVNMKDSISLRRYLAKMDGYDATTVDLAAADVNGDGVVNMKDGIILQRHIAKWAGYETLPYKN